MPGPSPAAVPGFDLLYLQGGQLLNDAPSCQALAILLSLAFEQAVSQQGDQVDQEHGLDALIRVDVQGAHFQILFADFEALLHGIFFAVQGQHLRIRQVGVIGDQENRPSLRSVACNSIGIDPPVQADFPQWW